MAHIVVEYSGSEIPDNVIGDLMHALHERASSTGTIKAADVKIRALPYKHFILAGKKDSFCHLTLFILAGRTSDQKLRLSEGLRETMVRILPNTKSLSVDVRDMDPDAYKKRLLAD